MDFLRFTPIIQFDDFEVEFYGTLPPSRPSAPPPLPPLPPLPTSHRPLPPIPRNVKKSKLSS